jgi:hypothetical protein
MPDRLGASAGGDTHWPAVFSAPPFQIPIHNPIA